MTTFVSKQYGRQMLGAVPDLWPQLCVALLTDAPTVVIGSLQIGGVELDKYGDYGYDRVPIPVYAWADPTGNAPASMLLDEDIVFAVATDPWPEVKWIALMPNDASTDALIATELITPTVVASGRQLRVAAGLLALRHLTL